MIGTLQEFMRNMKVEIYDYTKDKKCVENILI